jgi:hypothetical protein
MRKPYCLPQGTIVEVERRGDLSLVCIDISREDYLVYPIAPADLRISSPFRTIWEFHQLILRDGLRLVFETYNNNYPLPRQGATYNFCSWWSPGAMDAVRDSNAVWERVAYPKIESHDHCLLTWESISANGPVKEGYRSSHGWVTVEAYEKYILKDAIRVRNDSHSIEWVL